MIKLDDTQELIESSNTLKQKVVFIAGFLAHKHSNGNIADNDDVTANVSCEFLQELDRGSLSVPTLSTAFLVHTAVHLFASLPTHKIRCRKYLVEILSFVDAPLAKDSMACRTLGNVLLKAHVNDTSDRERQLGCLRRTEKLQPEARCL